MNNPSGTKATREFYDREGWTEREGKSVDADLFGNREYGPIRESLAALHYERIRAHLGNNRALLEVGCGGNPESRLIDVCRRYTGCDFSVTGIERARRMAANWPVPADFHEADACDLPFGDAQFNAVYCAHMLYHIAQPAAQAKAIAEMLRVLVPGGKMTLVVANPRPVLFLGRLSKRLIADTPVLGPMLARHRNAPLPYRPMRIGWMRRQLRGQNVTVTTYALPSTEFNQRITEHKGLGRQLWRGVGYLDRKHPRLSARLGCYVAYFVTKQ